MSKLWEKAAPLWKKAGSTFANPLATALGKNEEDGTFVGDLNYKLSNPLGQAGPLGRDILQKKEPGPDPVAPPVTPMPDTETLGKSRRRAAASRNRGRASTILGSDAETLG